MSKFYEEVKAIFDAGGFEFSYKRWNTDELGYSIATAESFMESGLGRNTYLNKDFTIEELDSYGGEDCGSIYYAVYKFTRGDESCIIRFDGHYQSHYGTDYEGMKEVSAKQKTVTVWI